MPLSLYQVWPSVTHFIYIYICNEINFLSPWYLHFWPMSIWVVCSFQRTWQFHICHYPGNEINNNKWTINKFLSHWRRYSKAKASQSYICLKDKYNHIWDIIQPSIMWVDGSYSNSWHNLRISWQVEKKSNYNVQYELTDS